MPKRPNFSHMVVHLPRENISSLKRLKVLVMLKRNPFRFNAKSLLPRRVHILPNALDLFSLAAHLPRKNVLYWQGYTALIAPLRYTQETHSYRESVMLVAVVVADALRDCIIRLLRNRNCNSYTLVLVNDLRQSAVNVVFLGIVPIAKWFMPMLFWCKEMRHVECFKSLFPPCVVPLFCEFIPKPLGGHIAGSNCDLGAGMSPAIFKIDFKHCNQPISSSAFKHGRKMSIRAVLTFRAHHCMTSLRRPSEWHTRNLPPRMQRVKYPILRDSRASCAESLMSLVPKSGRKSKLKRKPTQTNGGLRLRPPPALQTQRIRRAFPAPCQ